jgi:putative transposase
VAKKYDGSARRGPGRPRKAAEIVRLLVEMATRNTGWGYTRLRDALQNVGYAVGRNTIKRILKEQGIEPAPLRRRQYSWATFIRAHLNAITAADFFTVEVLSGAGLVRYRVFFVIDLASRRVEIAGISRCPDGSWMEQVARNLLDAADGFLLGKKILILDRDPLYTHEFRAAMKRGGVEVLRPSSPNLNAYAERFVLSIRSECLDRIVPLGEAHLRQSVSEFVQHYRFERNHQGLENSLIEAAPSAANTNGRVERRERLGGVLNFYHRAGA